MLDLAARFFHTGDRSGEGAGGISVPAVILRYGRSAGQVWHIGQYVFRHCLMMRRQSPPPAKTLTVRIQEFVCAA
jgi:hypothetical protein